MYKIKRISFINHPILKNLTLDFCDLDGSAAETIILAGENGTGKSTVIDELYKVASHTVTSEQNVEFENEGNNVTITYRYKEHSDGSLIVYANDGEGMNAYIGSDDVRNRYPFNGLFSDVDINFHAQDLASVTSLTLDATSTSRRSSNDLPTQIKQLLIDIQALDDTDIANQARLHPGTKYEEIDTEMRIPRFTKAFNQMFEGLSYSHVDNINNQKAILFRKNGIEIPIDNLSSGEKQIVYRGCFLLQDINATNGAFVFIDEPEISLHPSWQTRIMDYYKGIFTDNNDAQTSQIFAVTHSPFIIHNENRRNDKVIVLVRDENGDITVRDKPEYFKCTSLEVIQDAFAIQGFSADKPTVYLEGRTDERYFNKALEVFEYTIPFQFKWVGYIGDNGQEQNTGKSALDKAALFLIGRNLPIKNVCLYDCDASKTEAIKNNVYVRTIPLYKNTKQMKIGIENALVLDNVDVEPFYQSKISEGNYGDDNTIVEFKKMEFCEYICNMDKEELNIIFSNLGGVIDSMVSIFKEV